MLAILYRPPNAPAHFWSDLDNALEDLAIIGSETMLYEDINIDLLNPEWSQLQAFKICLLSPPTWENHKQPNPFLRRKTQAPRGACK